jgi:hypothetical protein
MRTPCIKIKVNNCQIIIPLFELLRWKDHVLAKKLLDFKCKITGCTCECEEGIITHIYINNKPYRCGKIGFNNDLFIQNSDLVKEIGEEADRC